MARVQPLSGIACAAKKQKGAALITVLFVMMIVMVLAVNMSGRLQLQIQRQSNQVQQQQAFWYAMGAEAFARVLLSRTLAGEETVHLGQDWAQQGASFPVDNGTIAGDISDLQACFNLNALQQAGEQTSGNQQQSVAQRSFQRLLELAVPELSMPPDYLTARIADWLDEDSLLQHPGSAEQDDYASLLFPYYSANTLMASLSELRVIYQLTVADFQLLVPYVCVIPEQDKLQLNVNTLDEQTAVLLAALIPELTADAAADIVASRPEQGFANLEEFFASSSLVDITITDDVKSLLTVKSSYFKLQATGAYLDAGFVLTSIFKREEDNRIRVLARRFGGQG
ncbi:type II secretion system minor pseudopilin GspK [Arsukibacterium sp.]|uniref:type II secretion system minor pseudopilin GspK n=1 Tax=Arsukibacterium sp. TaxID=1977258 RepID=UPI002FD8A8C9